MYIPARKVGLKVNGGGEDEARKRPKEPKRGDRRAHTSHTKAGGLAWNFPPTFPLTVLRFICVEALI